MGSARASCAVSSARLETQGARDVPGGASSTTAAGGWAPERDFWRNDSIKESATTTRESCGLGFWHRVESYKIIGACFEVYSEKGCGFLEPVYQECMEIELRLQGIVYVLKKSLALEYKGCPLRSTYEPDFICYDKIVLELKAVTELTDEHRAQVQNYLKATGLKLGLLVNFGHYPKAQVERIVAERGRYENKDQKS